MSHFAIKSHCAALIAAKWLFSLPLFQPLHPLCSLKSGMNRSNHLSGEEQRRMSPIIQKLRGRRRELTYPEDRTSSGVIFSHLS